MKNIPLFALLWLALSAASLPVSISAVESSAYKGHLPNTDIDNLIAAYPSAAGTQLDSCLTCHKEGIIDRHEVGNCTFCHSVREHSAMEATLNPFGLAYKQAGRSETAFRAIEAEDSDGDRISNLDEIQKTSFPGHQDSAPGLPPCASVRISETDLNKMPAVEQFLFLNASKHVDSYATYRGVPVDTILKSAGVDIKALSGVTVFSVDGYQVDLLPDELATQFPKGVFYGQYRSAEFLGDCKPWVAYPDPLPAKIKEGNKIPERPRIILATQINGAALKPFKGKDPGMRGEGPYRLIVPQREPSAPDQGEKVSDPKYPSPFDPKIHHNAGDCGRGVIAIQLRPSPPGFNTPDLKAVSEELYANREVLIFGGAMDTK